MESLQETDETDYAAQPELDQYETNGIDPGVSYNNNTPAFFFAINNRLQQQRHNQQDVSNTTSSSAFSPTRTTPLDMNGSTSNGPMQKRQCLPVPN